MLHHHFGRSPKIVVHNQRLCDLERENLGNRRVVPVVSIVPLDNVGFRVNFEDVGPAEIHVGRPTAIR